MVQERQSLVTSIVKKGWAEYMVLTGVFCVTFNAIRTPFGSSISDPFFVLAFFLLLWRGLSLGYSSYRIPLFMIIGSFMIWMSCYLGIVFEDAPVSGLPEAAKLSLIMLFIPTLFLWIVSGRITMIVSLIRAWVYGTGLCAILATAESLGIQAVEVIVDLTRSFGLNIFEVARRDYYEFGSSLRSWGLTNHPNHLGIAGSMVVPMAYYLYVDSRTLFSQFVHLMVLAFIITGVMASSSRAGLTCLAFIFLMLTPMFLQAVNNIKVDKLLAGIVGGAALISVFLIAILAQESSSLLHGFERLFEKNSGEVTNTSNQFRLMWFKSTLYEFSLRPMVGYGFDRLLEAHNVYLQLLRAGGLVAFCGALIYFMGLFLSYLSVRGRLSVSDRRLGYCLMVSILSWLLAGLVSNGMYDRYIYIPIGLLLALAYANSQRSSEQTERVDDALNLA